MFDAFEYVEYLGGRWRLIAGSCLIAVVLTGVISLLLPKRYTATASILIDPPAGNDVRTSTAVSPIYLESLKTYEHFASSDSLFQKAIAQFPVQSPGENVSIENLKRRILKVTKIRDTKILEISVTLPDPTQAQALLRFLAGETVKLSQTLLRDGETDLLDDAQKQLNLARANLDAAQAAERGFAASFSIDSLKAEVEALTELKARVRRESIEAGASAADLAAQAKSGDQPAADGARARVTLLEKQSRELEAEWRAKSSLLGQQQSRLTQVETQLAAAKNAHDAAVARFREVRNAIGSRGERLKIIDPGIVPQRPAFPNVPLNLMAAFLAALTASVVYASLSFVWRRRAAEVGRRGAFAPER